MMIRLGATVPTWIWWLLKLSVVATCAALAQADTTSCSEHPRDEFVNRRGQGRTCDWLTRDADFAAERIADECSVKLPSGVVETDRADVVCPVSCGKCPAAAAGTTTAMAGQEDFDKTTEIPTDPPTMEEEYYTYTTTTKTQQPPADRLDGLAHQLVNVDVDGTSNQRPGRPSLLPGTFHRRRWTDINTMIVPDPGRVGVDVPLYSNVDGIDPAILATLELETYSQLHKLPSRERNPFFFTDQPSSKPSVSPTDEPSALPSISPSAAPTVQYLVNEQPDKYNDKYFDYQPEGRRGPDRWDDVDDPPEGKYWKDEYNKYIAPSLGKSRCDDTKSRRQSPIDVRFDKAKGQCFEYHGVRNKIGMYSIDDPKVETQILPSKLRIRYPDNFGDSFDGATDNDQVKGPSADIPKGW